MGTHGFLDDARRLHMVNLPLGNFMKNSYFISGGKLDLGISYVARIECIDHLLLWSAQRRKQNFGMVDEDRWRATCICMLGFPRNFE